jgi:hypothetical protein
MYTTQELVSQLCYTTYLDIINDFEEERKYHMIVVSFVENTKLNFLQMFATV